ncbi:MAG: sulfatase-like hydrolase/transferase [Saprospiraceae bacterium]
MKHLLHFFLLLGLIILANACSSTSESDEQAGATPPNILFIFTDDQTYTSIHALGNEEIHTPNLDRLVSKGTTFTHAYNMGGWNGAICLASRAMIISGRPLWRAHAFKQNWVNGDSLELSWPKLMESRGYRTYMTGKWHVDAPADQVFQTARHIRPGMPTDVRNNKELRERVTAQLLAGRSDLTERMPLGYNRPLDENDDSWSPTDTLFGGFWQGGKHWSEVVRDDALDYLQDAAQHDDPFFMYLAFNAPHDPRQAPQEYQDLYNVDSISLPESWLPQYPYMVEMGSGPGLRDEDLAPYPRTPYAIRTHIKEYYAIISHLDAQIGKILDALEASGKADNTYIFFSADHGLSVGRHGLIGKQSLFDHSIRPPMMVVGPDIPAGQRVDADVYLQDIMATSLELAGVPKPDFVGFNSLLPLARGTRTESFYPAIYGAYEKSSQRMIRKDGYKLISYPKANKLLLFDLNNDPQEMTDLADLPEYKEKVEDMYRELVELEREMDDPMVSEDVPDSGR